DALGASECAAASDSGSYPDSKDRISPTQRAGRTGLRRDDRESRRLQLPDVARNAASREAQPRWFRPPKNNPRLPQPRLRTLPPAPSLRRRRPRSEPHGTLSRRDSPPAAVGIRSCSWPGPRRRCSEDFVRPPTPRVILRIRQRPARNVFYGIQARGLRDDCISLRETFAYCKPPAATVFTGGK